MNPRAGHRYTPLQEKPESHATPWPDEKPKTFVHAAEIEEPVHVQPTLPSYRAISTVRSAIPLFSIIIANCVCSACICLCLWGFSRIDHIDRWQKRGFNVLSLLLTAALSFGIAFLCDQIGLLARGIILESGPYSEKGVGTIVSVVNVLPLSCVHTH